MKNEKELRAWISTLNRQKNNKSINLLFFILPFGITLGISFFVFGVGEDWHGYKKQMSKETIVISLIVALIVGIISVLVRLYYYDYRVNIYNSKLIKLGIEDAKEDVDNDIYKNLIKISYKYLDEYYLQTRQQAQKGFIVTVSVSIMGAIIITIGIGAMFLGKTAPAYVTTAAGVVTEFIASVFFYLYNKTISSMSDYHENRRGQVPEIFHKESLKVL